MIGSRSAFWLAAMVVALLAACGGEPPSGQGQDAGSADAGSTDARETDARPPDAMLPPPDAACASGHVDCNGVCDGPGVPVGGACCASGHLDCNGVCDGPGVPVGSACCADGHLDCNGVCDGPGVAVGSACCADGHLDCNGVCDGPGVATGGSCCASGHVDCNGVCDGPGVVIGSACCADGHFDCNGTCDGPGVAAGGSCCADGHFDCNGVCDGPGVATGGSCCASGHFDCAGVCDGPGITRGAQCCPTGVCPPPTCSDGYVNGGESDIDCGGDCLLACSAGATCNAASDCAGLSACASGKCAAAGAGVVNVLTFGEIDGLARNPKNGYVYASIGAGDPHPNRVVAFVPGVAKVAWSVLVPASPQSLAVSDDGTTLYVGIQGPNPGIVKIDLKTNVASPPFTLGSDPQSGPAQPGEMVVVPGDAHQVAVATWFSGSTALGGVHFYRDGVERFPSADFMDWLPGAPFNTDLEVSSIAMDGAGTLLTYDGFSSGYALSRIGVADDGLHLQDSRPGMLFDYDLHIRQAAGRLFASSGQVIDPAGLTVTGTLPGHSVMTVSDDGSRVYFLQNLESGNYLVTCADPSTYTPTGAFQIASPNTTYEPIQLAMEVWGTDGLALAFTNPGTPPEYAILLPDALSRAHGCAPHATPPFRDAPALGPDEVGAGGAQIFALDVRGLATDPASGTLYASVGSVDGRYPNRIVAFPPGASAPSWSTPVGSEPGSLSIADDGSIAWVGLDGAPVVMPVNTSSRTAGAPIALGYESPTGEIYPALVLAVPQSPKSVAATGRFNTTSEKPGIAVFDDGVRRFPMPTPVEQGLAHGDVDAFAFAGPGRIYAGGSQELVTMDLGPSSLTTVSHSGVLPTQDGALLYAGGKIVSSVGFVIDPVAGVQLGLLPWTTPARPIGPNPRPDYTLSPNGSRVYIARPTQTEYQYAIDCWDPSTLALTGTLTFTVPGVNQWPKGISVYGTNSAAVRLPGALVILPDALSTPGCSPAP